MPGTAAPDAGLIPLSSRQDWCWEWTRCYAPDSYSMELTETVHLRGPLDVGALREAVAEVTSLHDALRLSLVPATALPLDDPRPLQRVAPGHLPLHVIDMTGRSPQDAVGEITSRPFDLSGPLAVFTLLAFSPDEHVLVLAFHHLVFDGASGKLLIRHLTEAYNRRAGNDRTPAAPAEFSYAAFIRRERDPAVLAAKEHRTAELVRVLREHGAAEPLEGDGVGEPPLAGDYVLVPMAFGPDDVVSLRRAARTARVTPYSLLLAALTRAVGEVYDRERLVGTTIAHGRDEPSSTTALGLFSAPVEIPFDLGVRDPAEFLRHVHTGVRAAAGTADLPYGSRVASVLGREGDDAFFRSCLAHVEFRLNGITGLVLDPPVERVPFDGLDARLHEYPRTFPQLAYASRQAARGSARTLFLDLRMEEGSLTGGLWYESTYHHAERVKAAADRFRQLTGCP
ncbi:hypothetical protein CIB93_20590 [Streptomyces sp. WZ.A104]|uniref:condensation domain-containing protein n=1 Tax=Streptomyces sp. WZ.A104 TaxID=2023771 RepID=UPI000BBBEE9D|nr:condensation domain-containing protein [Streptomyces sp. WZ.A104]PCG84216.1 hypothetical protein CIB93_20590 [Streptomyces sp. WZ.A104]